MSAWQGLRVKVRGGELSRLGPFTVIGRKPSVRRNQRGEEVSRRYMVDVKLPDGRTWSVDEDDVSYVDGPPPSREERGKHMTTTKTTTKATAKAAPKSTAKAAPKKSTAKSTAKNKAKAAPKPRTSSNNGKGVGHGAVSPEERAKRDETIVKLRADGEGLSAIAAATGMSVTGVRNAVIRLNA